MLTLRQMSPPALLSPMSLLSSCLPPSLPLSSAPAHVGPHQMSSGRPYLMRSSFSTLSRPMKMCVCSSFDDRAVK